MEIYEKAIVEKSYSELLKFIHFANPTGEVPLMFGGWAVYHYNPYAGSRDIDIIVTDENFDACADFLIQKEKYELKENRLCKAGVFFDLYKKSEGIEDFDFSVLYEAADVVYLKGLRGTTNLEVLIPKLSALFYSKIQALLKRDVEKDATDVIALLLKFKDEDLDETRALLTEEMKAKLILLQGRARELGLVTKPTKKNLKELNTRIKKLVKK